MIYKAIALLRVSTDRQELESQKEDLIPYIKSKGFKESEILWMEFKGASAITINSKYLKMKSELENTILSQGIKTVFLWHQNRLGRRSKYLGEFLDFFCDNKIQIYIKTGDFSLLDANGEPQTSSKIMWNIITATIVADTDERKAKTKRGITFKKESNLYNGHLKFGYSVDSNSKKFYVNEEQAEIVKFIFNSYNDNKSSVAIVKELNERGEKNEFNLPFNKCKVLNIIKDSCYCGEKYFEPIISEDLWQSCNNKLSEKNSTIVKTDKKNLLSLKLIKCPKCGKNLYHHHGRYVCDGCAGIATISTEVLDNFSLYVAGKKEIVNLMENGEEEKKKLTDNLAIIDKKIKTIQKELKGYETQSEHICDMYQIGDISRETYQKRIGGVKKLFTTKKETLIEFQEEKEKVHKTLSDFNIKNVMKAKFYGDENHFETTHKWINKITLSKNESTIEFLPSEFKNKTSFTITYHLITGEIETFYYFPKFKGGVYFEKDTFYNNEVWRLKTIKSLIEGNKQNEMK